ncbi:MAG: DUF4367 domain-containing protein [Clostridia bacterium]|nr:DUF4367 domain-containing protein [Clostridia bacterium]
MNKLACACELSLNDWFDTFPEVIPEAECSKKHEKWKKNLFNKMRNDRYHRFTTKTVKVMLIAATLCALLLTAFVVPSSREFIVDHFDIFSRYKLTESNNNAVSGEITVGYIPNGYELTNEHANLKSITYDYVKDNDWLSISKFSSSIKIEFDTETGSIENMEYNGQTYTLYVDKNNHNYLVWNKNDYIYQVDGVISKDELLKIAETIK